jgi:hypothetical protein
MADKKFIIEVRTAGFAKANRDMGNLDTSSKSYDKTAGKCAVQPMDCKAPLVH